jgi:hypothetical protein
MPDVQEKSMRIEGWCWLVGFSGVVILRVVAGLHFPDWPIPYFLTTLLPTLVAVGQVETICKRSANGQDYFMAVASSLACITIGLIITERMGFPVASR